jgi:Holliday junction DNA helicase RuvB
VREGQPIIGYDDIKEFLLKALKGEKRLHFLFEGSPATAKSLFMLCVQRAIPQAYYATGSRTTGPGLTDALLSRQPRVLLLDEIDKMDMPSYAVLLSLMESGNVVETKYRKHTVTRVNTIVIAAANSASKLPPELLSRFDFHLRLKPYTREEFIRVCRNYLSEFEGVPADLAEYIGVKVWTSLKIPSDVRKARGIARILDRFDQFGQTEVDRVIAFEEKYH